MRLGQLARKLAISPTEIIKFLESNSISASEGSNTRLADDTARLVLQQFDPTGTVQLAAEQTDAEVESLATEAVAAEPIAETHVASVVEDLQPEPVAAVIAIAEEDPTADTDPGAPDEAEMPEVIKAPKVALAGLKVLGKIELPEPKKKEPAAETTEIPTPPTEATTQPERRPRREDDHRDGDRRESGNRDGKRSNRNDGRRNDKSRKNPIAQQREREAQEAQLKKEAQAKAEKERRTQHYYNKVKTSVPTKPARLLREHVVEMSDEQTSTPTTLLGKFWKWFRS